LPPSVKTGADLESFRNRWTQMAVAGEPGRMWYERSSQAVLDAMGGDKDMAEKFVQLLAIYSPRTDVPENTSRALRAWYQWLDGKPIKTGAFSQADKAATNLLVNNKAWGGTKTN